MKSVSLLLLSVFCVATCVSGYSTPARADLRFCNQTSTPSLVIEGHEKPKTGLTVTGTVTVKAGRCEVIVPGRLTAPSYFVHVDKSDHEYGGSAHLCVMTMYHFEIGGEDAPDFHCNPHASQHLDIHGIAVREELEDFLGVALRGSSTLVITERKNAKMFAITTK